MKKSKVLEGVMELRFEKVQDDFCKKRLTTAEAAELLGISVRTFLRRRECQAGMIIWKYKYKYQLTTCEFAIDKKKL